jgi:hypothetical protein
VSTATRELWIDGVALWSPTLPGWAASAAALADDAARPAAALAATPARPAAALAATPARPAAALLAPNERRRAPDGVLAMIEVAAAAAAMAGADVATLPSVFASAHGDLATTDALCRTLASNPALLSPTRFHHSVHNAASGYWAIAAGCPAASSALAALEASFAAGLLEAAVQVVADDTPVLLVAGDTEATGALASTNTSRGLLALALVLAPRRGPHSLARLRWWLAPGAAAQPRAASRAAAPLAANASAPGLVLLQALAGAAADAVAGTAPAQPAAMAWPLSATLCLHAHVGAPPAAQAGVAGA